jgi:hypothetical protein
MTRRAMTRTNFWLCSIKNSDARLIFRMCGGSYFTVVRQIGLYQPESAIIYSWLTPTTSRRSSVKK